MHGERDYLVKRVFPQLQEWCERRRLRLVDIDLRWGVREEAALDQQTMKICLGGIDRCQKTTPQPNFAALAGKFLVL